MSRKEKIAAVDAQIEELKELMQYADSEGEMEELNHDLELLYLRLDMLEG